MRLGHSIVVCGLLLGLAGCGSAGANGIVSNLNPQSTASATLNASSMPCCFVTIQATITQIMPDNPNGFGHQRFIVQETSPDSATLEVDNDETYGTRVPGLYVGEALEIRGVEYHDPNKDGIHWTHHDNVPGDAGYIKTPDGTIYQ